VEARPAGSLRQRWEQIKRGARLSRRDWIMLAIGGSVVLLATSIGIALSHLFR
jgi:hypothetical protein